MKKMVATEGYDKDDLYDIANEMIDSNPADLPDALEAFQEVASTLEMVQERLDIFETIVEKAGGLNFDVAVEVNSKEAKHGVLFYLQFQKDDVVMDKVEKLLPRNWKSKRQVNRRDTDLIVEPDMT